MDATKLAATSEDALTGEFEPLLVPVKCAYGPASPGLPFHLYQEYMENAILENYPRCITVWTRGTKPKLSIEYVSDENILEDLRACGLADTPQSRDFLRQKYVDRHFGMRSQLDRELEQLFSFMWKSLTLEGRRAIRIMPESRAALESSCPIALRSLIIKTHCTSDRGHTAPMSHQERVSAARDAYYDCRMKEGESIYEYSLRFKATLALFKELDDGDTVPSDEAQARDFLRWTLDSLFLPLKQELRRPSANVPKTFDEALRLVVHWIPPSGTPLAPLLIGTPKGALDATSTSYSGSIAGDKSQNEEGASRSSEPPMAALMPKPSISKTKSKPRPARNPSKSASFCDFCMRKGHVQAECFYKHPEFREPRNAMAY